MDPTVVDPLVRKRTGYKNKVVKILAAVKKHDTTPLDDVDVTLYLDEVNSAKVQFSEIQDQLIGLCTTDAESETQYEVSAAFDDKLRECMKGLTVIKNSLAPSPETPENPSNSSCSRSGVNLPKLQLPKFDGKFEEWMSFEDLFTATIHNDKSLTGSAKLQYLKSYLKGDAAKLIQAFQVTDSNYKEAWDILIERYRNERDIVQSILKRLFGQPTLTKASATGLQSLADTTSECLRSLKVLKRPVDHWDDVLVFLMAERMDPESRREWALTLTGNQPPTLKEILDFINQYVRGLLASGSGKPTTTSNSQQNQQHSSRPGHHDYGTSRRTDSAHYGGAEEKCQVCTESHPIYRCSKFHTMTQSQRQEAAKTNNLCNNCLRPGHFTPACKGTQKCKKCGGNHHTLLHWERAQKSTPTPILTTSMVSEVGPEDTQVLLATALAKVTDQFGEERICRVLIDSGSQATIITEECATSLGLRREKSNVEITGVSATSIGSARGKVVLNLTSCISKQNLQVEALILPKVTGILPKYPTNRQAWRHIRGRRLADPEFNKPGSIDILLGADVTNDVLVDGLQRGAHLTPLAQNTIFGWVLFGRVPAQPTQHIITHHVETDEILKRFWEIEELPNIQHLTAEEKSCEAHFSETHTRDETGRYVVKLPFKTNVSNLGHSRDAAVRRLRQVEKRLSSKPAERQQYLDFMREYEDLNHMELIPSLEPGSSQKQNYYLPHHYVLKLDSSSTKLRVVFDGSAKTSTGLSLNSTLMIGPTIQDDLFTRLVRFRCHPIVIKADLCKMYRQFEVAEEDRDFQRILWRESPDQPIRDYRLRTLTYGTASAPFLATRCLKQLAMDESSRFPSAAAVLSSDLYVDDLMSGAVEPGEAIQLTQDLCDLVKCAGLELRKWSTNDPAVLDSIPLELREKQESLSLDSDSTVKALGVKWNPSTDNFIFEVIIPPPASKLTKRVMLSELAKVFDPLGWLSPTTIQAKMLFQELWKIDLDWDERLPFYITQQWDRYQEQLHYIKSIQVPRCLITAQVISQQLHGFCDASEKAYAAAVFLRCEQSDGTTTSRLVTAKTKVTPIKQKSIPKLELCGALMLAKLMNVVKTSMKIDCQLTAWTDSTVVLGWLGSLPRRWKTFVANRVAEIQEIIPFENWHHVVSEENPADCASRGISASEPVDFSLWWRGPDWLSNQTLPIFPYELDVKSMEEEEKPKSLVCALVAENSTTNIKKITLSSKSLPEAFENLKTVERVTAYVLRFIKKCRKHPGPRCGKELLCSELQDSLHFWIQQAQAEIFAEELKDLKAKGKVSVSSKILQLNPFIDHKGLLRVGGRLQKSNLPEETKHQIILPPGHMLTRLIIRHHHQSNLDLHAGFQLLWCTLQQKYWILRARDTIRHEVRRCVQCRRQRAETAQQLMGSLPSARVNPGHPFLHCGVDFAGPFATRVMKGRNNKTFKSYFAIFICLATKAVHLEGVGDLTTEAFIGAFRRFSARRGIPTDMYCDCGSNFIGADRELQEMLELANANISHQLADTGTQFHFNSPSAPHQGGLWEAGVKSAKFHLKRVVGSTTLTYEEFQTILAQIEACLNSRPLCPMSSDPADLTALTAGHFLIGKPLTSVPEPDLTPLKINRLSRWQRTQQMLQHFWNRWSTEYLTSLQQRFKWTAKRANLKIGDLVLVKDDMLPPTKWKMGRVLQVDDPDDSLVRNVVLKTAEGELTRSIVKCCPLLSADE